MTTQKKSGSIQSINQVYRHSKCIHQSNSKSFCQTLLW